jgi:hypothetical protein
MLKVIVQHFHLLKINNTCLKLYNDLWEILPLKHWVIAVDSNSYDYSTVSSPGFEKTPRQTDSRWKDNSNET